MEYDVEICNLSQLFYNTYPESKYPEIMNKNKRPYTCLLIDTHEDYFICIPFRSSISHKDAFLFTSTARSQKSNSGLDYQKSVIIKNGDYIDATTPAVIDNDEYVATITNIEEIVEDVEKYISRYVNHVKGEAVLHERDFQRHYRYSTLKYFHDVLGLAKSD